MDDRRDNLSKDHTDGKLFSVLVRESEVVLLCRPMYIAYINLYIKWIISVFVFVFDDSRYSCIQSYIIRPRPLHKSVGL